MTNEFTYTIKCNRFDENYNPAENTYITTNFVNLARGENCQENLRNTLIMMNNRFNTLAHRDNPHNDHYVVGLGTIPVEMSTAQDGASFPVIEILQMYIVDKKSRERHAGIAGNNLSFYARDYDFSVLLLEHNKSRGSFSMPDNFGELHGNIPRDLAQSSAYKAGFSKAPVICLSVSSKDAYRRIDNEHPVLDIEYAQEGVPLTKRYFSKMGLQVRYFIPKHSVAPLAFYFTGDLLSDYTSLELITTISMMETFQKIYRPEIYNANSVVGRYYQPNLNHLDHSLTKIVYDRGERSPLAIEQDKFTQRRFINPHKTLLEQRLTNFALC